jgi:hypothetical protein
MLKNILTLLDWIGKKIAYKRRMENKVDEALILLKEHEKKLIRLEMLEAMRRDDRAVVHQLWDTYKALGGNSYMKELYKNYCKGKKSK